MKVTAIEIENIKSFANETRIEFSDKINVFVGKNNSGKSTILLLMYHLQSSPIKPSFATKGTNEGEARIFCKNYPRRTNFPYIRVLTSGGIVIPENEDKSSYKSINKLSEKEPYNVFVPFLSDRKLKNYQDTTSDSNSVDASINHSFNIASKIEKVLSFKNPHKDIYIQICEEILGFVISADGSGKGAGYVLKNQAEHIHISLLGEGVKSLASLIVNLCTAENKIFIIEEPENDIHPQALKSLLNLIIKKSDTNQFFISTHSHIVTKYLGSVEDSSIFKVSAEKNDKEMFVSKAEKIDNTPEARRELLEELGYELFDFDLWKGWLFLEESSAETIINKCLIPLFIPNLQTQLRTFCCRGNGGVKKKFDDFNKFFIYLHLEPSYRDKVWVKIDSGDEEEKIIKEMRDAYKRTWDESHFGNFNEHDFESYYPPEFKQEFENEILKPKKEKSLNWKKERELKGKLAKKVVKWGKDNPKDAKQRLLESAGEVIDFLKEIEAKLNSNMHGD